MSDKYSLPEDKGGMVSEPAASIHLAARDLPLLRHHVTDAIYASQNPQLLYAIWLRLLQDQKEEASVSKHAELTDEQLESRLSQFPDWEENAHADLSGADYRQYRHRKSPRTIKAVSKWL